MSRVQLKSALNMLGIFVLSALAGVLLFFSSHNNLKKPSQTMSLPYFVEMQINQKTHLAQLKESTDLGLAVENIMQQQVPDFKHRLSPVYETVNSNYIISFFQNKNNEAYFMILKKSAAQIFALATMKVTETDSEKIKLSYGEITLLDQDQFNLKTLKLSQINNLENSF